MIFTCAQKLTYSQLNLPHGTKQKRTIKLKIKTEIPRRNGPDGIDILLVVFSNSAQQSCFVNCLVLEKLPFCGLGSLELILW